MATYAAVAARGSPTATSNPSPPPPAAESGTLNAASQGSAQASYTKAHPEPQSSKKPKDGSDAPPAYGSQQGTFPVHPYPDVEAYPNGGNSGGRGGQPPPNPNPNTAVQNGSTAYHLHHREPTWWRFVKALATAVLIYLLASLLVESMYLAAKWGWDHRPGHDHDHFPGNYHIPADVSLHQCATNDNWKRSSVATMQELSSFVANPGNGSDSGDYPYASYTSFDLPLGSTDDSSVVFLSRGPRLGGHVSVVTSARQRQGQISATIIVKYYKSEAREEVKACIVEREDGAKGFGIFTPNHNWDWDHRDHQVSYEAMVVLPEGSPFMMKQLETDVPNSSQHLNLDGNKILFENVLLKGSNGHVEVEAPLAARKVTIQDSNSDVTGHFNVTDELTIDTTNARVEASITMYRVPELENVPTVDITTSNGVLHSDILLMDAPSTSLKTTHPHYKVHTSTTNSRLDVSFTGAPTDAVLTFNGSTTNGGASARLYQTYSGSYELETSNSVADLVVLCPGPAPVPKPKDEEEVKWDYAYGGGDEELPLSGSGGGKQCKGGVSMVNEEVSKKTYKKGLVEWVPVDHSLKEKEKDKWESSVGLKTTNGPAVLQL